MGDLSTRYGANPLAIAAACAVAVAVLARMRLRELHRLRVEVEQATLSSDQLAEQLKMERAAAAEFATVLSTRDAQLAALKAQLESLTAKLEFLDIGVASPGSAERLKVPSSLQVGGETRAAPRGQLTPLSTEKKWNTALLRSSLFAADASSDDTAGLATLGKPKKLAL
jgi:hypothetical protein